MEQFDDINRTTQKLFYFYNDNYSGCKISVPQKKYMDVLHK